MLDLIPNNQYIGLHTHLRKASHIFCNIIFLENFLHSSDNTCMREKPLSDKNKKPVILNPLHKVKITIFLVAVILISITVAAYDTYNMSILAQALT